MYLEHEEKMRSIPLKLPSIRTLRIDNFPLTYADVIPIIGDEEDEPAFPKDIRLLAERIATRKEIAIVVSDMVPQECQRFLALQTYAFAVISQIMQNHATK